MLRDSSSLAVKLFTSSIWPGLVIVVTLLSGCGTSPTQPTEPPRTQSDAQRLDPDSPLYDPIFAQQTYAIHRQQWSDLIRNDQSVAAASLMLQSQQWATQNQRRSHDTDFFQLISSFNDEEKAQLRLEIDNLERPNLLSQLEPWFKLTRIQAFAQFQQKSLLNDWHHDYPSHPANHVVFPALVAQVNEAMNLRKVAILLPFSGKYANAAQKIQHGLLQAYLATPNQTIELMFYDSMPTENLTQVYEKILADDADWIIGPLLKSAVQWPQAPALEKQLKLNWVNALPPREQINFDTGETLEQTELDTPKDLEPILNLAFALNAEDDMKQLASLMAQKGHQRIVVLSDKKNEQDADYLRAAWQQDTFASVMDFTYDNNPTNLRQTVEHLSGLKQSINRHQTLNRLLQLDSNSHFRVRRDVDAIVSLLSEKQQAILQPQLNFAQIPWPVYAGTRLAPAGRPLTRQKDLAGLNVLTFPFLYDSQLPNDKLMAFGYDAWLITQQKSRLQVNNPLARIKGATGWLWLDDQGRLRRSNGLSQYNSKGQLQVVKADPLIRP